MNQNDNDDDDECCLSGIFVLRQQQFSGLKKRAFVNVVTPIFTELVYLTHIYSVTRSVFVKDKLKIVSILNILL